MRLSSTTGNRDIFSWRWFVVHRRFCSQQENKGNILLLLYFLILKCQILTLRKHFKGWLKLYFHQSQSCVQKNKVLLVSMGHLGLLPDGVGRHGYGSGLRGLLGHRAERQGLVHLVNLQLVHILLLCSSTGRCRWGRGFRCRRCWLWGWFRLGGRQYLQCILRRMNKKEIGICLRNCRELSPARILCLIQIQEFVQDAKRWVAGGNQWSFFF